MEAVKAWWSDASSRDQISVLALGVAGLIFILFQFIYTPVAEMRVAQEQRVESQRAAYGRVKALANEWIAHEKTAKKSNARSSSVEKLVESSFAKHGLRVSQFDASGRAGIRVRFEAVSYEKFVTWLHDMEITQSLKVKDVSVAATPQPGFISVSITIQKT